MKAMIWKEWRENARWGALALVALGLAIIYVTTQGFVSRESPESFNLFERTAPLTLFLVPLFATALGLMQVGTELRRDQWAFLVHRPASRSTIFAGKAVAGLSIYVAATLLPMLLLGLWMQLPGSIPAPFDWRLILAPLANILAGAAFYFAGMLTAIRPARWYGSRALGFGIAVWGLVIVNVVPEFWQALLAAFFSVGILGLAAWGSFLTTGTYDRQPKIAKIALGMAMLVGLSGVVGGVTVFVLSTISDRVRAARALQQPSWVNTRYVISPSGRVLRITIKDGGETSATDLQGHRVAPPKPGIPYALMENNLISRRDDYYNNNFRSTSHYYLRLAADTYAPNDKTVWYWVRSQNRALQYSRLDNRLLGTLGPQGFRPIESGLAAPFAESLQTNGDYWWSQRPQYLRFAHSVYFFDGDQRTATPLYTSQAPAPLQGVAQLNPYGDTLNRGIALVDQNTVRVLRQNGQLRFTTPLEAADAKNLLLSIVTTPKLDRFFLWYQPIDPRSGGFSASAKDHISEFSAQGKRLARYDLPPLTEFNQVAYEHAAWYESAAAVIEVPPVAMTAATIIESFDLARHPSPRGAAELADLKTLCLTSIVVGLLCAALTFRFALRCDLSRRAAWGWAVAAVLMGLSAPLLLIALHEWPTRVLCPSCGKKRSINRERCEHCGASFPAPPADETSIFDDPIGAVESPRTLTRV